ncbi:MAG: ferrous iron transport protein A [Planctomycetes bacterium]|nr:ferrous iron transport protein A [Planctomycetota bacterium]
MALPGPDEAKARGVAIEVELSRLAEGTRGRVVRVESSLPDSDRLQALGLCEGRIVEVLRAGDPLIVKVHGSRFGLAAARARGILVRLERPAPDLRG